ncbi:MAG: ribulose-phosphate 3-epimerase [Puniceicoccales bacterium]|jgi:ribulose-phosphate 3-epimerase|nr:ribulose-phosphate 3-epimerase [Puniceicoccales bacterium]
MNITVAPSILGGNLADLRSSLVQIRGSGARWVHIDVMDGYFAPNLTFGPQTVQALADSKQDLFFDVHLMLEHPEYFVGKFAEAGADLISIHIESRCDVAKTLQIIRTLDKRVGLAINPETAIEKIFPHLDFVDLALVMGVYPGFCGQKFIEHSWEKVEIIRKKNPILAIEIDGGVNGDNARLCIQKGANILVVGTSFFKAPDPRKFVQQIEHV